MSGGVGAKGTETLTVAMADPLLIDVRIGGIMTLYMTPEESETQAKTEESAAKEDAAAPQTNLQTAAPGASAPANGTISAEDAPGVAPDLSVGGTPTTTGADESASAAPAPASQPGNGTTTDPANAKGADSEVPSTP